jgi:hypothetical protein
VFTVLWFLAFALSRITALLLRLLLLFLRLRWTLVFRLLRLRLSTRSWGRSRWRRDTLASWLLLSHRPRRSFRLGRAGTTFSLLLLSA